MPVFLDSTRDSVHQILNEGGKIYSVVTGSQSLAANEYLALELANPADSDKMIGIIRIEGGSTGNVSIDVLRNASINVSGISVSPRNRNWSFADASSITAEYVTQASDPTSGGELLTTLVHSGGTLSVSYDGEYIIPGESTNKQFTIRAQNVSSQSNVVSIVVTWIEVIKTN